MSTPSPLFPDGGDGRVAVPDPGSEAAEPRPYVAPRTPMEQQLTEIFEELLDVDRVGIQDTFFDLNGFSLLATQLAARIYETFNVELTLRDVFESPTVETLAQALVQARAELAGMGELEALLAEIE
jgi:acyl carrier protein